ncbi:unnamed protein product [Cladocopium goreaui]|uniref:Ubiquinone/menaquinone biosynthesis C-methyltransferase UbiE n=1 Tax=Cladocopium goreaui TaxID=2562237 RepID=A0A9P1C6J9_9DINO|nr:unnamed protein product [Cladocopium goreaui]|mmetsp:Transcript_83379/g.170050  ORF Transcript_83379/g.170050 Transcript_83379/m.170050 type:complete len:163 (-) Transcript_83379:20-508(-)
MVLENRGVTFGVHDFASSASRSRQDYHVLKTTSVGDTRARLFGTGADEGTFNASTRAVSYGTRGHDPKGEYVLPQRGTLEMLTAEATWPSSVTGGFVIPFQGQPRSQSLYPTERTRRVGALGRNIVGNCTIKDEGFYYHGPHSHHYGNNSGCRSTLQYRPER